jgi:hypothetical protein
VALVGVAAVPDTAAMIEALVRFDLTGSYLLNPAFRAPAAGNPVWSSHDPGSKAKWHATGTAGASLLPFVSTVSVLARVATPEFPITAGIDRASASRNFRQRLSR